MNDKDGPSPHTSDVKNKIEEWFNIWFFYHLGDCFRNYTPAAVVHLNFLAVSTFPVPVCTVSPGHWVNKADTQ